ncbi:hypothetical protein FDZ71_06300, partial [bacterium]
MLEIMKKAMLAGIGALTLSEQKARAIIDELVEQGKISSEEGEKLVKELMEKAEASKKEIEAKIGEQAREWADKIGYVKRAEFEALE